jgi:murein DD-endopeptidase MepM/ murein hydrolase activator NlpD
MVSLFGPPVATPPSSTAELFVTVRAGDKLASILERTGIMTEDARAAALRVDRAFPSGLPAGTELSISLRVAEKRGDGHRLEGLTVRTPDERRLEVVGGIEAQPSVENARVSTSAQRFTGRMGSAPYWALRSAAVPAEAAVEYLAVLSSQLPGSQKLKPTDHFDLIVSKAPRANGAQAPARLLYAAVEGSGASPLRALKWIVNGEVQWVDPRRPAGAETGLMAPVSGRVTSTFGSRAHPILRFIRFHRGIDIAAPWGAPIRASDSGKVSAAGWHGGHGQQVRIAHQNGLETSYSHMSRIAVTPGSHIRRGEVIGFVGSTGLSTGPHVHYEVRRGGELIDPQSAGDYARASITIEDRVMLARHVRELFSAAAQTKPQA